MKSSGDMGTKASEKKLMGTSAGMKPNLAKAIGHVKMQQAKGTGAGSMKIGKPDMDCD